MKGAKKILVRVPNWLGDLIMARPFLESLQQNFPGASIDLIVKSNLVSMAELLPGIHQIHSFSKADFPGSIGALKFGRSLRQIKPYDLFFCLPDSFSSALMAWGTGSKKRFGFRKEGRSVWLTRTFTKPSGKHRSEEYLDLLKQAFPALRSSTTAQHLTTDFVALTAELNLPNEFLAFNVNSEADSRRIPINKATEWAQGIYKETQLPIVLVGGPNDEAHTTAVATALSNQPIINLAGKTKLPQLAAVLQQASLTISTDSGPAHLSAAVGCPTVVVFGAGNEQNTGPQLPSVRTLRLPDLECAPCVNNTCHLGTLDCLNKLKSSALLDAIRELLPGQIVK